MPNFVFPSLLLSIIFLLPFFVASISSCNGPCQRFTDCGSVLECVNGKCGDGDGTHICTAGSGHRKCEPSWSTPFHDTVCLFYDCSPPVVMPGSTPAKLKHRDFRFPYPSECDGKFHQVTERVVAMSTGWYNGGSKCGKNIRVFGGDGRRSVVAKVVDECDSLHGCDEEREGKPPCGNNVIEGSEAVWKGLGLNNTDYLGGVNVTWTMA